MQICESNPEPTPRHWTVLGWKDLGWIVLVGALVFGLYGRCLAWRQPGQGFALDNKFILMDDPRLHEVSWNNIQLIFTKDYWHPKAVSGLYRPITTLSYLMNYSVFGNADRAAGYVAVNLALHWLNAGLVYWLALLLVKRRLTAALIASVFAAHPVAVESVANIVGRADLLATASVLSGLLFYVKSTLVPEPRRPLWLGAVTLTTALGVFCKESAVIVLGMMILYDLAYRVEPSHASRWRNLWRHFWLFTKQGYAVVLSPFLALLLVRMWVFDRLQLPVFPFVDNPLWGTGFFLSRLTAFKVIGKCIGLLLWPVTLSCDYSYNQIPLVNWPLRGWQDWQALVAIIVVAALITAACRMYPRRKDGFFFTLLFFVLLLPTSNLIFRTGCIMAERFLYMPSIAFAGCAVLGLSALRKIRWAPVAIVIVIMALGVRTIARTADWENNVRLWSKAVEACPNSFKTHKSYGYALYEADSRFTYIDQAISEAEKSLAVLLHPPLPDIRMPSVVPYQLGVYYRIKGDVLTAKPAQDSNPAATPSSLPWYNKSIESLQIAVRLDRAYNEDQRRREIARGRKPEQVADDGLGDIYTQLGETHMRLSQHMAALNAWQYWRHLSPGDSSAYTSIASVWLELGQVETAIVSYVQAILLNASSETAWSALIEIYPKIDPQNCAISTVNGHPRLNASCPIVHKHVCAAYRELIEIFLAAKRFDAAQQARNSAVNEARCPKEPLDQLLAKAQIRGEPKP